MTDCLINTCHTGIGHEQVNAPMSLPRQFDQGDNICLLCDIGPERSAANRVGHIIDTAFIEVPQNNAFGPFSRKPFSQGFSDT